MHQLQKIKKLPLKTVYYLLFLLFIVIPILAVLSIALLVLNRQFRQQALENVRQAQETVMAELKSDIDVMSMRLSHLIYTNDNEILAYAAGTDTYDGNLRYEYEQRLEQAGNLAPDVRTDRSQKIEMVAFYQSTGAADRIREYNRNYLNGKNRLGITMIRDQEGGLVFSTQDGGEYTGAGYTCVRTPLELNDTVWYVESYIKTRDLPRGYWHTALLVLAAAVMILALAGYYSRYFLHSIVY